MVYFFLFIFGSAIGSFLNVVSLRYEPGRKLLDLKIIGGRSRCLRCRETLKWYELIPLLSFAVQLGKCRSCGQRISLQYPLVELLSGLIFVFIPLTLLASGYTLVAILVWLSVFLLFLLLSIIDFRHYIIPDSINLSLAILGIFLIIINSGLFVDSNVFVDLNSGSFLGHYSLLFDFSSFSLLSSPWINRFFAATAAMIFFGLIIVLTRGKGMGWGDFKLAGALGLIFGWPDAMAVVFLAFIVGAAAVAPLLFKKQKTMKDVVPFGPFLIIGASLVFFFGYKIIDGYFKLFYIYL